MQPPRGRVVVTNGLAFAPLESAGVHAFVRTHAQRTICTARSAGTRALRPACLHHVDKAAETGRKFRCARASRVCTENSGQTPDKSLTIVSSVTTRAHGPLAELWSARASGGSRAQSVRVVT